MFSQVSLTKTVLRSGSIFLCNWFRLVLSNQRMCLSVCLSVRLCFDVYNLFPAKFMLISMSVIHYGLLFDHRQLKYETAYLCHAKAVSYIKFIAFFCLRYCFWNMLNPLQLWVKDDSFTLIEFVEWITLWFSLIWTSAVSFFVK